MPMRLSSESARSRNDVAGVRGRVSLTTANVSGIGAEGFGGGVVVSAGAPSGRAGAAGGRRAGGAALGFARLIESATWAWRTESRTARARALSASAFSNALPTSTDAISTTLESAALSTN